MEKLVHIAIVGFQSLRRIDVELGQITTIVGHSDSGKSAFIRAIKSASLNRRGADFLSHGASACAVRLKFAEGASVLWKRSLNSAQYFLELPGQPVETFSKLRAMIPVEVDDLLRLRPIDVDKTVFFLQFTTQYDPPFLVDSSNSVSAARFLAGFSGFEVFGEALKLASAERSDRNKRSAILVQERVRLEEDLVVEYVLEALQAKFNTADLRLHELLDSKSAIEHKGKLLGRAAELRALSQALPIWEDCRAKLAAVEWPDFEGKQAFLVRAGEVLSKRSSLQALIQTLRSRQQALSVIPDLSALERGAGMLSKQVAVLDQVQRFESTILRLQSLRADALKAKSEVESKLAQKVAESGEFCPFSDTPVPEGRLYGCSVAKSRDTSSTD